MKVVFSWSGGKDSTFCLHQVLAKGIYDVCYLLTSVNGHNKRVSLHGIHESLIIAQAKAIGIPVKIIYVYEGSNAEYEEQMEKALANMKAEGIESVIFGDIFLEDLRSYRENNLAKIDMKAVFPLWKKDTSALIQEFLNLNYRAVICCVNDAYLGEEEVGKLITSDFIKNLPPNADPCGENGEYHSFCFEGPIYKTPLKIKTGQKIYRELDLKFQVPDKNNKVTKGFWYSDILLER